MSDHDLTPLTQDDPSAVTLAELDELQRLLDAATPQKAWQCSRCFSVCLDAQLELATAYCRCGRGEGVWGVIQLGDVSAFSRLLTAARRALELEQRVKELEAREKQVIVVQEILSARLQEQLAAQGALLELAAQYIDDARKACERARGFGPSPYPDVQKTLDHERGIFIELAAGIRILSPSASEALAAYTKPLVEALESVAQDHCDMCRAGYRRFTMPIDDAMQRSGWWHDYIEHAYGRDRRRIEACRTNTFSLYRIGDALARYAPPPFLTYKPL